MHYPGYISFPFFAYSFLTLLLPLIFVARRWLATDNLLRTISFLQTLFEIMVEVGIIYTTGNIQSAFSGLFILTVISSSLVNNLAGTLGVATLISFSYAFIIWYGLAISGERGSSSRALETIFSTQDAAFYSVFLHILTFYLVAFISGFLAERLRHRDVQLADASQALKQAKLDTNDILRHLNSGLLTIDRDGKIIFFNQAAEDILDMAESDVRGRGFQDVFSERMPNLADNLSEVLQFQRRFPRNEIEITNRTGIQIPLGISTSVLLGEDNSVRGVIAIFRDLTETKQLEEKIRAADKMAAVGELSAAIAHEIRNPLAAISGSVEILKSELELSGENRRLLELIMKESTRLNNILSDFLMYARSNRPVFGKVELCRLVSDVFEVVRHHPSYREDIALQMAADDSYVYIFGDENKIKQILINLVVNGCEAIDVNKKGEVAVHIIKDGLDSIKLQISDNGQGIEEANLPKIFAPFYSTKKNGTGLGLAIVQRLAENLNIDLLLRTRPGLGTTFILQFGQPKSAQKDDIIPQTPVLPNYI